MTEKAISYISCCGDDLLVPGNEVPTGFSQVFGEQPDRGYRTTYVFDAQPTGSSVSTYYRILLPEMSLNTARGEFELFQYSGVLTNERCFSHLIRGLLCNLT